MVEALNPDIDSKDRQRFETSFKGLDSQKQYCEFHFEEYKKACQNYDLAMQDKLNINAQIDPQYYRIAFESHGYAFFRCLHALIESVPYMLNIILQANPDIEFRHIGWSTLYEYIKNHNFNDGNAVINDIRQSQSYLELEHLVNVSKHRRIPRIDSCFFKEIVNQYNKPEFSSEDLCIGFRNYNIEYLMIELYNELFPKTISLINCFVSFHSIDKRL
ncbi:hypothetical protein ACM9HF_19980 [Colwellia sp. RE-S-Sl-9]